MTKQEELTEEQKELLEAATGDQIPESIALEYIENTGDDDLSDIEEAFEGDFSDDKEFAQEMAERSGTVDFKNQPWPQYCIDWEYAARELMYDYFEIEGYYFRNM